MCRLDRASSTFGRPSRPYKCIHQSMDGTLLNYEKKRNIKWIFRQKQNNTHTHKDGEKNNRKTTKKETR
jgi:hypothetical protein